MNGAGRRSPLPAPGAGFVRVAASGIVVSCVAFACTARPRDVLFLLDGGADGADASPASLCPGVGLTFCEPFESPPAFPPWGLVNFYSGVVLDDARAFRGASSLHVRTSDAPADVVIQGEVTETAAVPVPDFFARFFIYLPATAPDDDVRIAALLQADPPQEGSALWLGRGNLGINLSTSPIRSTTALPLGRWVCLEWQVTVGAAGETRVWQDGAEVTALHVFGNTDLSPSLGRMSLGFAMFPTHAALPPVDLWFDELALAPQRIGCDR